MVRHLLRNVYQFSVAKNYSQLKALIEAMVASGGEISSFTEFRDAARKIDERYNITYLRTEYDTAISSAQMAAHWARFGEGNGDPMLRYVTAGDERVRASHAALNGLQRPMSDPIWDMIYPPNGWHCRCTVVEVNGKPTPNGGLRLPDDVPPLFRTNLAKTGMLFPKGHPYFKILNELKESERKELLEYANDRYIDVGIKGLDDRAAKRKLCLLIREVISDEIKYNTQISLPKSEEREDIPLKVTPFSIKTVVNSDNHSWGKESKKAFLNAMRNVNEWKYLHSKRLGYGKDINNPKDKSNIERKKARGVQSYNYYLYEWNSKEWLIGCEVIEDKDKERYEQTYFIIEYNKEK